MKILQFSRSPIVKGVRKLKEVHDGIWKNRIDSARFYEDTPICNQCGSRVVKLKYKFKLKTDLFHVKCRVCTHTWYTIRKKKEIQVSQALVREAKYKGVSLDDWLEIIKIRNKKLEKLGVEIPNEKTRNLFRLQ